MPAAAKRTLFLAVSLLALVAMSVVGAAGGAPPDKDREAPSAPKNLRVSEVTQTLVRLAWDPSSDNVAVAGYYVFGDRRKAMLDTALDKPEYTLDRLSCGQSSTLTIIAFDDSQNRSEKATMIVSSAPCTDTLPPATPAGFRQVATSDDAVVLAWNPSADNVGVVGYGVYRNLQRVASPSDPTVPLAGLACGSSYDYAVDAVDAAGNRSSLAKAYVQTSACASSPEPPAPTPSPDTQAPSTPSGLAASSITQSALTLSWSPSTDNVQVTGYDLYRGGTKVASPASPGASQSGLACGTSYTFAVEALDAAGNRSSRATLTTSTSACSTTIPPPPTDTQAPSMPTGLGVSSATPTSASLSWNPSTDNVAVEGYRSYRDGAYQSTGSQPAATISGLSCGTAYTFAVDAFDAEGNASNRVSVIGSTLACPDTQVPSTPAGVVASSRTATSIALTWSASSDNIGVTGYGLYRGGSLVGTGTTTTGIFAGLTCNTNYTLAVDAYDAAGNRSAPSTVMVSTTACPDTVAPTVPSGLATSDVTASGLTLSWTASTDNVGVTGYDVYRGTTPVSSVTSTSSVLTALGCGTSYALGVVARDAAGNSSAKATLNVSTSACAAPTPSTPPPPSSSAGPYGVPVNADGLANLEIGKSAGREISYRFKADHTGEVTSLRIYLISRSGGYMSGTGGKVKVEFKQDDGSGLPTGSALASAVVSNPTATSFPLVTFGSRVSVTEGQRYHLVFTNPDSDPISNYVSIDDLYLASPTSPMQPTIDDIDLAVVWKSSGASGWAVNRGHTPIYELAYSDGHTQGQRYMDARSSSGVVTIGGSTQARQLFTPAESRSISAVNARIRNSGSSAPLVFELSENGRIVASATVSPGSVSSSYQWVSAPMAYALKAGASYALALRSSSGPFSIFPYQKGTSYGFANPFPDGRAESSSSDLDFPIYFS